MGSPFGPTISEFYVSHIKNKIFKTITKPKIYVRYENIFITTHSYNEINSKKNSVLNFTTELKINKKFKNIPFLDILTDSTNNNKFTISPYKSLPTIIPPYLTTTVNVPKNIE